MSQQHRVRLTPAERTDLQALIRAGRAPARDLTHARILLKADRTTHGRHWTDGQIAEALEVSSRTVARVRAAFCAGGLPRAVPRQAPRRVYARTLDGAAEAQLIALACSPPPAGLARWTIRLLADRLVELQIVAHIAPETVRTTLKKTRSNRG